MTLLIAVVKEEFPDTQRQTAISSLFSSVVHKVENNIKSPRSLFSTGFAGFCMSGGQMVVRVVNSASKRGFWGKGERSILIAFRKPISEGRVDFCYESQLAMWGFQWCPSASFATNLYF